MTGFIVCLIVVILLLLWSVIDPRSQWQMTAAWRYRDPDANEPSDVAFAIERVAAGCLLIVFAVVAVLAFKQGSDPTAEATPEMPRWESLNQVPEQYDGYAETPTSGVTVDPFPSAAGSVVGSGTPVTIFSPVLADAAGGQGSESSRRLEVEALYYPWMPGDHPEAFASADVIDSRTALATLDLTQATTVGGGEATLGDGQAILVRLTTAACAVTAVTVSERDESIEVEVSGITDPARCGPTTEGAYVAVPLTDELVAKARSYQSPDYTPIDPSETSYRRHIDGTWQPTIFAAVGRAQPSEVWMSAEMDREISPRALLPWTAGQ